MQKAMFARSLGDASGQHVLIPCCKTGMRQSLHCSILESAICMLNCYMLPSSLCLATCRSASAMVVSCIVARVSVFMDLFSVNMFLLTVPGSLRVYPTLSSHTNRLNALPLMPEAPTT